MNEIRADYKSLINMEKVFNKDEKLLDNQYFAFLLKSIETYSSTLPIR